MKPPPDEQVHSSPLLVTGGSAPGDHADMVDVAQLVERRVVVADVAGSSPVIHPEKSPRSAEEQGGLGLFRVPTAYPDVSVAPPRSEPEEDPEEHTADADGVTTWKVRFRRADPQTSQTFYVEKDAASFAAPIATAPCAASTRHRCRSSPTRTSPRWSTRCTPPACHPAVRRRRRRCSRSTTTTTATRPSSSPTCSSRCCSPRSPSTTSRSCCTRPEPATAGRRPPHCRPASSTSSHTPSRSARRGSACPASGSSSGHRSRRSPRTATAGGGRGGGVSVCSDPTRLVFITATCSGWSSSQFYARI